MKLILLTGIAALVVITGFFFFKNVAAEDITYFPSSQIATHSAQSVRVPIIMYHYVEYADPNDKGRINLSTTPANLDFQIASLKNNGYQFFFAKEVPEIINEKSITKPVVLTFDDGYEDFYWNVLPILKKYYAKGTVYVIANLIGHKGYLNEKELLEIRDSGLVEIGAHTLNHAYLKDLKVDIARKEIFESKKALEKLLGMAVPSLAYPYGAFSKETLQLVKAAGFTNAVSVIPGVNQSEDNLFYLFRLRPGYLGGNDPGKALASYRSTMQP